MNNKVKPEKNKTNNSSLFSLFMLLSLTLLCFNTTANESDLPEQNKFVTVELSPEDIQSLKLGKQIHEALLAINHPKDSRSIHKITVLGWDQRYYLMIRGWLVLKLQADQSIYTGSPDQTYIADRIAFIKKAIRTIDLE